MQLYLQANLIRVPVNPSSLRVSAPFIADPPKNTKDKITRPNEHELIFKMKNEKFCCFFPF